MLTSNGPLPYCDQLSGLLINIEAWLVVFPPIYSSIYWRGHRAFAYKTKFRTGLSHSRSVLATLFGLTEIQVSPFVASARKAFLQDLVPFYIGFPDILHSQIIENHTKSTDTTKELFF